MNPLPPHATLPMTKAFWHCPAQNLSVENTNKSSNMYTTLYPKFSASLFLKQSSLSDLVCNIKISLNIINNKTTAKRPCV